MKIRITIFLALIVLCPMILKAEEWKKVYSLTGSWKFTIGDDSKWAQSSFNDKSWEEIYAPSPWEDQGFNGYDGYAWYRKHITIPESMRGKGLYLYLGSIDDVDEVYINGKKIGSTGVFPPKFETAYNFERRYPVPETYLNFGKDNVIAIRIYDSRLQGGILRGDIGFFVYNLPFKPDINLEGEWKFTTKDDYDFRLPEFKVDSWKNIIVPGKWENQGFDHDGFAWYRKNVFIPENLSGQTLILLLGRIDDADEVFINGKSIGSTGNIENARNFDRNSWQTYRVYYIPAGYIVANKTNTIAVRVYDGLVDGGIYSGPVCIVSKNKFTVFWNTNKRNKSIWELLFGD